jgi:hypothetical protein
MTEIRQQNIVNAVRSTAVVWNSHLQSTWKRKIRMTVFGENYN